jgi:hypothetical protein
MTTKILTGGYSSGYYLNTFKYSGVELTKTATMGGSGLYSYNPTQVTNFGDIAVLASYDGVDLASGGTVTNGDFFDAGKIYGDTGIVTGSYAEAQGRGTVVNYSYVGGRTTGIRLINGGQVTNTGFIRGQSSCGVKIVSSDSTVNNSGTIEGYIAGVSMYTGTVTNGSLSNPVGLIEGHTGVSSSGAVDNFATIGGSYDGILTESGSVTNGAATDRGALIRVT